MGFDNYVTAAIILLGILFFFRKEPFHPGKKVRLSLGSNDKYAPYCNLNLTSQDLGFPAVSNINRYWKTMPTAWRAKYSPQKFNQKVNNVRSTKEGSELKVTKVQGLDPNYYHDPGNYAKRFPGDSYYPDTSMPYQEPVDNVSTANNRTMEGLNYNGIQIYSILPV